MSLPAEFSDRLRGILGTRLSEAAADRDHHAQSEAFHRSPPPDAVAWPQNAEEVAAILAACNDARVR